MSRLCSRRGASSNASSAAILIAIIAGLLVLYILFLPPAQREALLFGDGSGGGYGGGYGGGGQGTITQYGGVLILSETPGTLRAAQSSVKEHSLPSTTLYTSVQTQEIKSVDSLIVKNGVFAHKDAELTFDVAGPGNNYLLSFNVDEAGYSALRILLNGVPVYERPIRERTPQPIPLPNDLLHSGENVLTIQTLDTGLAFWRPNTYVLRNVLVSADLLDASGSVGDLSFSVAQDEYDRFQSAELRFVPECDPKVSGRLILQLNPGNRSPILFNGFADCGVQFKAEVPQSMLRLGENHLVIASQGGQFLLDRLKLVVSLKESDYPLYYFNLPRDMYDSIAAGHAQVRLTLTFADYRDAKDGEVVINGFVQSFHEDEYAYQALVDPGVLTPGPNTIKVIPHVDRLDIAELKIELV